MAGEPGARVEMHLRDLKLPPGSSATLSVRAVDAAGNLGPAATAGIRVSDRLPAALPGPATATSRSPSATRRPCLAWDRSRSPSSTSWTRSIPSRAN